MAEMDLEKMINETLEETSETESETMEVIAEIENETPEAESETPEVIDEAESEAPEAPDESIAESKAPEKKKRRFRLTPKALLISAASLCLVCGAAVGVLSMFPYEIYVGGEHVCSVKSREDASDAIAIALGSMAVEGTRVKIVKSDEDISVSRSKEINTSDVLSVDEAAICVSDAFCGSKEGCEPGGVTIISSEIGEKAFTPDPEYVRDDSMPAGYARTVEEGEDGLGQYRFTYTTVNGVEQGTDEVMLSVIEEGKSEVIAKGTRGLPPGEDWQTYEGDPIFSSGPALVSTAKKYIGAPYKWGGTNLKTGVSCIGFVKAIYAKYGIKIPMSHPMLKKFGVGVAYENAQPGDIICYKEHTGIYIGNGKMIDAASNRGVGIARVRPGMVVTVRRVPRS
ncbi:MAG: hypothetical protein E7230_05530 [Clostridiales bacterium]|nr:hypothetical protein [Clostridiales bacterium]